MKEPCTQVHDRFAVQPCQTIKARMMTSLNAITFQLQPIYLQKSRIYRTKNLYKEKTKQQFIFTPF